MENALSCSRPKLRDHFKAFLRGQTIEAEEIQNGKPFASRADLRGSLSGQEVRIKTESSACEKAASNYGFFTVPIKTEKPEDEAQTDCGGSIAVRPVRIKTEKFDIDEVGVSGPPTTSAPLISNDIAVKKEKEDTTYIKTEKEENYDKSTSLGGNKIVNSSCIACTTPIKIEDDSSDIGCIVVKTEKSGHNNDVTSQQLLRDCRVKLEAYDSAHGYDTEGGSCDVADSSIHSPNPPDSPNVEGRELRGGTDQHEEQDHSENLIEPNRNLSLTEGTSLRHGGLAAESNDPPEYTHNLSRERKAKKLAKMMLKELEENMDFVDVIDGKRAESFVTAKSFFSHPKQSSVPRRLQDLNNEFNKYKGIFSLQECSVKVRRLSEEVLVRYGVKLDDVAVEEKVDVQTLKKGLFSCSECSFRSHHVKELRVHQWKHRTDTAYHQCRECNYRTKWLPGIVSHVKRVHRKLRPYACPHCDHKSASSTALKQHVNIHTSNKPYKCPYCNYRSVAQASLRSHVYTHTGEKPYACPHCSYRCTQYPHLKSHLYVHTREKPYACELCEYRTTQSTHLRSHMQVMHTDVKPFKCEHCTYASKSLTGLRIHVRKHTGERPYACVLCTYKATQSTSLRVHMRGHFETRRCRCSLCGYSTHTPFSLKNHMASCHETK